MQFPVHPLIYNRIIAAPISDNLWSDNGSARLDALTSLIIQLRHVHVRFGHCNYTDELTLCQSLM